MPNVLGTLGTATIVLEALDLVFTKRPLLKLISHGFTNSDGSPIAQYNQAVITRTLSIPPVANAGSPSTDAADTDVSVTLNQFKQLSYSFDQSEYSSTDRNLIRERAEPMATALANWLVDSIAALWTIANYPTRTNPDAVANGATITKTVKASAWDYTHLVDVRTTLNKAGVPDVSGRFYAANADNYGAMLQDMRIVAYLNNPVNAEAIRTGLLPDVAGFRLAEYPNLTSIAGGGLVGFAGAPDSTVYAMRVPSHPNDLIPGLPIPGRIGIVTEPKSGMSVMVVEYVDMASLRVTTKILWMFGAAVGNKINGQLITSA